jgi:hypothetical protein
MAESAVAVSMDRARLNSLESVIERTNKSFIECGHALLEIRDRRGYRLDGYHTFDHYLKARWPRISRSYASRLISAARFADELQTEVDEEVLPIGNSVHVPETEWEAREMKRARRTSDSPHPTLASESVKFPAERFPDDRPFDPRMTEVAVIVANVTLELRQLLRLLRGDPDVQALIDGLAQLQRRIASEREEGAT